MMGTDPSGFKEADLPVENVSREDAQAFCKKVREITCQLVRLPTEAEWEYAFRGGTTAPYYWGRELNGTQANCSDDDYDPCGTEMTGLYFRPPSLMGTYAKDFPHPWGLSDVHVTGWEWFADRYDAGFYVRGSNVDPVCPESEQTHRVLRGGSWFNVARLCRAAIRVRDKPTIRDDLCGFRVVFGLE